MNKEDCSHIDWCSDPEGANAFVRSQTAWFSKRQAVRRAELMNTENELRYQHGSTFTHPTDEGARPAELKEHSAYGELKFEDLREQNFAEWAKGLVQMSDDLHGSFMSSLFQEITEVTTETGNVVSVGESGSFPAAMLEMMKKIELGVDRDGKVTMPTIAAPEAVIEKQIAELEAQPQDFKDEFERVKQMKVEEAFEREAERKARFKGDK